MRGTACLLTYQGLPKRALGLWKEFKLFVRGCCEGWGVRHWCATLETNDDGTGHFHLMVEFTKAVDRTIASFVFKDFRPNVQDSDYLGEGFCRKRMQTSINRAMFYVWADKIGTQRDRSGKICVDANYFPCWVPGVSKYAVQGRWAESLWKAHKLSHAMYETYIYLCRDGVVSRVNNLSAVRGREDDVAESELIESNTKRLRSDTQVYQGFPPIPEAVAWLLQFSRDALRYPLLIVIGPSFSGKTEWANSLFKKPLELQVGTLMYFPDGMRKFDRKTHDGLILDDVRDLEFVAANQEKLQSSYHRAVEFAPTPGGTRVYRKYLFRVPIVITINYSTKNLQYLAEHDWLMRDSNRVVVEWPDALRRVQAAGV